MHHHVPNTPSLFCPTFANLSRAGFSKLTDDSEIMILCKRGPQMVPKRDKKINGPERSEGGKKL